MKLLQGPISIRPYLDVYETRQCLQGVTHSDTGTQTLSGRLFMVHRRDCFTTAAIHGTAVIFRKQEASGDKWIAKYQCHCMEFNVHITQQTFETLNRCQNAALLVLVMIL